MCQVRSMPACTPARRQRRTYVPQGRGLLHIPQHSQERFWQLHVVVLLHACMHGPSSPVQAQPAGSAISSAHPQQNDAACML